MTTEVLRLGHRKVAMIAGIAEGNDRAANRINGVRQAIQESGGEARLIRVIETDYSQISGGDAITALMSEPETPTAIICGNDVLATGAIVRARQQGIEIPQQVSITGFDDIGLATAVYPSLTTVRVPQEEMGRSAARLLLELLSGEGTPKSIAQWNHWKWCFNRVAHQGDAVFR